jgi:hypothetical protein
VAVDSYGRSSETIPVRDLAAQLLSPITNMTNVGNPASAAKKARVADAVNEVAAAKKENISSQSEKDKSWVEKLIDFIENFDKQKKEKVDKIKSGKGDVLNRIAKATESLYSASQSQNTLWVGICHINAVAQRQLAEAISMSDCCAAVANAVKGSNAATNNVGNGISLTYDANKVAGGDRDERMRRAAR